MNDNVCPHEFKRRRRAVHIWHHNRVDRSDIRVFAPPKDVFRSVSHFVLSIYHKLLLDIEQSVIVVTEAFKFLPLSTG